MQKQNLHELGFQKKNPTTHTTYIYRHSAPTTQWACKFDPMVHSPAFLRVAFATTMSQVMELGCWDLDCSRIRDPPARCETKSETAALHRIAHNDPNEV